jgi:hypothetical protein
MAGQQRNMEGDNDQRRKAARDARRHGKTPSEVSATLGASKQRKHSRNASSSSHQQRLEARGEGKRGPGTSGKPRPGSRDTDPKRTNRWE